VTHRLEHAATCCNTLQQDTPEAVWTVLKRLKKETDIYPKRPTKKGSSLQKKKRVYQKLEKERPFFLD